MSYKLGKRSLDRLIGVDERMVAVVKYAINVTKQDFLCDLWAAHHRGAESIGC